MFKTSTRIWLEVTAVKAERLQEISEDDATAEGVSVVYEAYKKATGLLPVMDVPVYRFLWDSLNGKTHPWDSNPWVWAYTFKPALPAEEGK